MYITNININKSYKSDILKYIEWHKNWQSMIDVHQSM